MTTELRRELRKARPSLRLVSPVSFWFIMLMGVFNLIIGFALLAISTGFEDPVLGALTTFIPAWLWGCAFFSLGAFKLFALRTNRWRWTRLSLLAGVLLKSGWAVALIIRTFMISDNIFLATCWLTIAITQVIVYVYFLPPQEMRLFSGKEILGNG